MPIFLEDAIPVVAFEGLNTAKSGTLSGAYTFSGVTSFTGGVTFSSTTNGIRRQVARGTDVTISVAAGQSGIVFVAMGASGTQTYTLPSVATAGLTYTFICGHASGEILVTPAASQPIIITAFTAVGVDADTAIVAPTAGTGVKNSAATNAIGDSLTLVSDGTSWFGIQIASGIWASQ